MPEVLTRYPDIVIDLLTGMGAKCGQGTPQILKKCPTDSFCQVPNGELCIVGLESSDKLTQFGVNDIFQKGGEYQFWHILLIVICILLIIWIIYRFYIIYQENHESEYNDGSIVDHLINLNI